MDSGFFAQCLGTLSLLIRSIGEAHGNTVLKLCMYLADLLKYLCTCPADNTFLNIFNDINLISCTDNVPVVSG